MHFLRDLARNFTTWVRDSLLGTIWHPRMKNMCTGIRIWRVMALRNACRTYNYIRIETCYALTKLTKRIRVVSVLFPFGQVVSAQVLSAGFPGWVVSARFKGGSFGPDSKGESIRPDIFILGKQLRYLVEFTWICIHKIDRGYVFDSVNALKELLSFFGKFRLLTTLLLFTPLN